MIHARPDYNRIQDPAVSNPSLCADGSSPIGEDEPVFLLRARDKTAPETIVAWVNLQIKLPDHDAKAIQMALEHVTAMVNWQIKNGCKTADVPLSAT